MLMTHMTWLYMPIICPCSVRPGHCKSHRTWSDFTGTWCKGPALGKGHGQKHSSWSDCPRFGWFSKETPEFLLEPCAFVRRSHWVKLSRVSPPRTWHLAVLQGFASASVIYCISRDGYSCFCQERVFDNQLQLTCFIWKLFLHILTVNQGWIKKSTIYISKFDINCTLETYQLKI